MANERLGTLAPEVREELLMVLMAPSETRADVIRQFYARARSRTLAEVLIELEADDLLRLKVAELLKGMRGRGST